MVNESGVFFTILLTSLYFSSFTIKPIFTQNVTPSLKAQEPFTVEEKFKREVVNKEPFPPIFGTVLWNHNLGLSKCITERDKTLLKTRLALDKILKNLSKFFPKNDEELDVIWEFLKDIYLHVKHVPISLTAYYDAVGGYLKSHLLPMTKISFYAGNVSLASAKRLFNLYDHSKKYLDTQGHGWLDSSLSLANYNPQVYPILVNASSNECNELLTLDDTSEDDGELLVALPKLELEDDGKELGNIFLPFRKRRVFNLRSQVSSFVFVRYFVAATECYRVSDLDSQDFNRKLFRWTRDRLVPHLTDELIYPGLGGLLRVMRTMKASELDLKALNLTSSKTKKDPTRKKERGGIHSSLNSLKNFNLNMLDKESDTDLLDDSSELKDSKSKKFLLNQLFSPLMFWITIFSILGTAALILIFWCMKRRLSKRKSQLDLRLDPINKPKRPQPKRARERNEPKRKLDTMFKRDTRWSDHETSSTVFSSSMMTRPKDFVHPVTTQSMLMNEKQSSKQNKKRGGSFIAGPTARVTKTNDEAFKVNSDSGSEDELYDPRKVKRTMDLTKPPQIFSLDQGSK